MSELLRCDQSDTFEDLFGDEEYKSDDDPVVFLDPSNDNSDDEEIDDEKEEEKSCDPQRSLIHCGPTQPIMDRFIYGDMIFIQHSLVSQLSKEVDKRRLKNLSSKKTTRIPQPGEPNPRPSPDTRSFSFNTPLREQDHRLYDGETLHEKYQIDLETYCVLRDRYEDALDLPWGRAFVFRNEPNTIYLLPGSNDIKLIPGLVYSFISSDVVTKGGTAMSAEYPLPNVFVPYDVRAEIEVRYILKKSLQWTVLPLTPSIVVSLFSYFSYILTPKKRSKGEKKNNFSSLDIEMGEADTQSNVQEPQDDEWSLRSHVNLVLTSMDGFILSGPDEALLNTPYTLDELVSLVLQRSQKNQPYHHAKTISSRAHKSMMNHSGIGADTSSGGEGYTQPFNHTTGTGRLISMVFCHEDLKILYPYYSKKQLLRLPVENIRNFAATFRTSLESLCFYPIFSSLIVDQKRRMYCNIRELPEEDYLQILNSRNEEPNIIHKMAVDIYTRLKNSCAKDGDKFTTFSKISLQYPDTKEAVEQIHAALDYLVENGAVGRIDNPEIYMTPEEGENSGSSTKKRAYNATTLKGLPNQLIYLGVTYVSELAIVNSFRRMFSNYRNNPPLLRSDVNEDEIVESVKLAGSTMPPLPSHPPCSEQVKVVEAIKRQPSSPIVVLGGWGGSGKTAALRFIVEELPPNSFLVLTAQAANAAGCQERVHFNSQTIHLLLTAHHGLCPKSPYFDSSRYDKTKVNVGLPKFHSEVEKVQFKQNLDHPSDWTQLKYCMESRGIRHEKGKCFISSIETIIIDEISLLSDEVFAALLHVLTTCGNLKQIIICGDHRQKPQISFGCLIDDLRKGFPLSIIEFSHCHRFETGILFKNAEAVYNREYGKIKYNDQNFKLINVADNTCFWKKEDLIPLYDRIFTNADIRATEDNMIITRTNERKNLLSSILRKRSYGNDKEFFKGQKIYLDVTNTDAKYVPKQILKIVRVEDVQMPARTKKGDLKRSTAITLVNNKKLPIIATHDNTMTKPSNYRQTFRRIIATPISKDEEDYRFHVYIPHFAGYYMVKDASCLTSHFVQGFEVKKIYIDQTEFWEVADHYRVMFTNVTRGREEVIIISSHDIMKKCCENLYPPRKSIMWHFLLEIERTHTKFLRKYHAKGRRALEKKIRESPPDVVTRVNPFFLEKNPRDYDLNVNPSTKVNHLARKEGDKYDADAIVRREKEEEKRKRREEKEMRRYQKYLRKQEKKRKREEAIKNPGPTQSPDGNQVDQRKEGLKIAIKRSRNI